MVEHEHAVPGVAGGIGGHEDGFNRFVLHHLLNGWIGFLAAADFGLFGTPLRHEIRDGHNFDIWMVLKPERGPEFADSIAHDTQAEFAI